MDPDILLLHAAKKMNEGALTQIFDRYASSLYHYALRLCDDPLRADQIVGEVFAQFVEKLSAGAGPAADLRMYLYEIAYRLVAAEMRSDSWSGPRATSISLYLGGLSTTGSTESQELLDAALRVIKYHLTEDQRHVIILRFLEGFTLKQTAAIIGKKVGNVKVIQNRATAALRNTLEKHGFEITNSPMDLADFLASSRSGNHGEYHPRLQPS